MRQGNAAQNLSVLRRMALNMYSGRSWDKSKVSPSDRQGLRSAASRMQQEVEEGVVLCLLGSFQYLEGALLVQYRHFRGLRLWSRDAGAGVSWPRVRALGVIETGVQGNVMVPNRTGRQARRQLVGQVVLYVFWAQLANLVMPQGR